MYCLLIGPVKRSLELEHLFEFPSLTFNNQSCDSRKGHLMGLRIRSLCTLYSVYVMKLV